MSEASVKRLFSESNLSLRRLVRYFDELNDADAGQPLEQRFGISVVLATWLWGYGVFAGLRRLRVD